VEPRTTLLDALRDQLGLTGAKRVCDRGECGACTVLVDGEAVYGCMTLALESEGRAVTTIEGLADDEGLHPIQRAFIEADGYQCGFCTSGQILAAKALLDRVASPSPEQIRLGVSGNLCRCGAYAKIFKAVDRAGELLRLRREGGR
jgi:aerobic-type carbon monoxide dehydrogenase small subunit (CoxS/CutS family)